MAPRLPDPIGSSLTQLEIDRTGGVGAHLGTFTNLKECRWGKGHPVPFNQIASIEHGSLYHCFSNNDVAGIIRHICALNLLACDKQTRMDVAGVFGRLTVKVSRFGWSMLGGL